MPTFQHNKASTCLVLFSINLILLLLFNFKVFNRESLFECLVVIICEEAKRVRPY